MRFAILLLVVAMTIAVSAAQQLPDPAAPAAETFRDLSLDQLGRLEVTIVSKQSTEVWRTAAAIAVLTQDDIRRSGATTLPELLRLVAGVQVARVDSDRHPGLFDIPGADRRQREIAVVRDALWLTLGSKVEHNNDSGIESSRASASSVSWIRRIDSRAGCGVGDVPRYVEADARVQWQLSRGLTIAVVGQNPIQSNHVEFYRGEVAAAGIRRSLYGI